MKLQYNQKESEDQITPIIATFQQNIPSEKEFVQIEFNLLEQQNQPTKKRKLLKATSQNVDYIGKTQPENMKNCKYYLGVVNPNEDKNLMKIFDIDYVFNLTQNKKNTQISDRIESNIAKSGMTIIEQKQSLVEEFGTLKAKRKVQQMMNNKVQEENISSKLQIQKILSDKSQSVKEKIIEEGKIEDDDQIQEKKQFLPDFDLNTLDISKVYNINSIISKEEFDNLAIEPYLVAIKNKSIQNLTKNMTFYVKNLIDNFDQYFHSQKMQISVILKYLLYLDNMLKFNNFSRFTKPSIEEISQEANVQNTFIAKNILNRFYQATPIADNTILFVRSQLLRDKYICYSMILALYAFNFKMDASKLALQLKLDPKKMIQYAKEIGCTVNIKDAGLDSEQTRQINIALKAPLKLQKVQKHFSKN